MKFGPVPVAEALGGVLAHRETLTKGTLPKGHILTAVDLAHLIDAGLTEVTVARLDADDVDEDAAAAALARALVVDAPGLRLSVAATGRVNVIADVPGLAALSVEALHAVNRIDPMITVATVPDLHRMDCGGLVATIKIIAYAVPQADLDAACAAGQGAIALHRPVIDSVALIETRAGRDLGDKGERSLVVRLDRLGVGFAGRTLVDHDSAAIAEAGRCRAWRNRADRGQCRRRGRNRKGGKRSTQGRVYRLGSRHRHREGRHAADCERAGYHRAFGREGDDGARCRRP